MTPEQTAFALCCPVKGCGGDVRAASKRDRPWRFQCVLCDHTWKPDNIDITQRRAGAIIDAALRAADQLAARG